MGTITTDESPIFVRDHRSPNCADQAKWASNYKNRVGLNRLHCVLFGACQMPKAIMLKLWQLYGYVLGGIEDSAGISAALPRGRQDGSDRLPVTEGDFVPLISPSAIAAPYSSLLLHRRENNALGFSFQHIKSSRAVSRMNEVHRRNRPSLKDGYLSLAIYDRRIVGLL